MATQPCRKRDSVACVLARIAGYRWPAEYDPSIRLSDDGQKLLSRLKELPDGDNDGLLGVPSVAGERSLADRVRTFLGAAFGSDWSDALERRLISEADERYDNKVARDGSLEAWVRNRAFRQHCALFDQRPFLWHISDGLKDGFSVFVHYHRFDQANLRKLTYHPAWRLARPSKAKQRPPLREGPRVAADAGEGAGGRKALRHLRALEVARPANRSAGIRTWTTACARTSAPSSRQAC